MSASTALKLKPRLLSFGLNFLNKNNYSNNLQNKVLSSFYIQRYGHNNYSTGPTSTVEAASSSSEPMPFRLGRIAGSLRTHITRYLVRGVAVKNLYECCAHDIDYIDFFKTCAMPDTFQSWFYVLELHVWMLLVRLKSEGKHGKNLSFYLVDNMWKDLEERIKLLGVEDTSHKKESMEEYAQQFFGLIVAYDEGLLGNDRILASAIWRNMFYTKESTSPEHLALLVGYVRKQMQFLEQQDSSSLLMSGKVKWLPLHDIPDTDKSDVV